MTHIDKNAWLNIQQSGLPALRAMWLLALGASPLFRTSVTFCLSPWHLLNHQLFRSHSTRQFYVSWWTQWHLRHDCQGHFLGVTAFTRSHNWCYFPSFWATWDKFHEGLSNGWLHAEHKKQEPLGNAVVGAHPCPAAQVVQNASYGATTC